MLNCYSVLPQTVNSTQCTAHTLNVTVQWPRIVLVTQPQTVHVTQRTAPGSIYYYVLPQTVSAIRTIFIDLGFI